MDSMWQEILKAALLGTARNALALPVRKDVLGEALAKLEANAQEASLLSAAAVVALYDRAGQLPARDAQPLPAASEMAELPCCNARAAQHLSSMLSGEYERVLPEWFAALATANKRVPAAQLPAVLQFGKTEKVAREVIAQTVGKRGLWLAAQNPAWDYFHDKVGDNAWETGTHRERLTILQRRFELDPLPAKALVKNSWRGLNADERSEFLSLFQRSLAADDEPFIEAALDDVSKGVRRTAALLLASLPGSAYVQRNFERAKAVLMLVQPKRKKPVFEVGDMQAIIKAAEHDIVNLKQRLYGEGEQAAALRHLMSIVPPSLWCQHFASTPEALLQATHKSEWKDSLVAGWAVAARNHKDVAWIKALLSESRPLNIPSWTEMLFQSLPVHEQEAVMSEALHQSVSLLNHATMQTLLCLMPEKWSRPLSQLVLTKLFAGLQSLHSGEASKKAKRTTASVWPFPSFLRQLVLQLPVEMLTEAEATMEQHLAAIAPSQDWLDEFEKALNLLRFRHEALAEITKD